MGPGQLDLARGEGKRGEHRRFDSGESGLTVAGYRPGLVVAGSADRPSREIRQRLCRLPTADPEEKRHSMVLRHLLS